uniref:Uncharacterized protein n=1 Tax=Leishmania guyanensis TaxID=5670 RepID=A0A1E1ISK8_LEIGU|nr:Hypothetical protein BN36_1616890 [Leishmania guyanensis]
MESGTSTSARTSTRPTLFFLVLRVMWHIVVRGLFLAFVCAAAGPLSGALKTEMNVPSRTSVFGVADEKERLGVSVCVCAEGVEVRWVSIPVGHHHVFFTASSLSSTRLCEGGGKGQQQERSWC